jgi:hypothetical protein
MGILPGQGSKGIHGCHIFKIHDVESAAPESFEDRSDLRHLDNPINIPNSS